VPIDLSLAGNDQSFKPTLGTFKSSTGFPTGHKYCFGCHWDADEPKKDNCQGCHLFKEELARKNWRVSLNSPWFKDWPDDWAKRRTVKFRHEQEDHKAESCSVCHSSIMQLPTSGLPDVPITTCTQCHLKITARTSITKEMFQEDDDTVEGRNNNPGATGGTHECTGCHMNPIGTATPPCSHFVLFGDRYFSVEDYPKSAKEIQGRCKK